MKTTVSDVKTFRTALFDKSMALIDRKGADYNRDQQEAGDTLFNLRVCEILGVVPSTEEGILVRLSDKFMRLISLTKPGREAAVKDESVLDTIADIHNYVDYLGLIWQQRRQEDQKSQANRTFSGGGGNSVIQGAIGAGGSDSSTRQGSGGTSVGLQGSIGQFDPSLRVRL